MGDALPLPGRFVLQAPVGPLLRVRDPLKEAVGLLHHAGDPLGEVVGASHPLPARAE